MHDLEYIELVDSLPKLEEKPSSIQKIVFDINEITFNFVNMSLWQRIKLAWLVFRQGRFALDDGLIFTLRPEDISEMEVDYDEYIYTDNLLE